MQEHGKNPGGLIDCIVDVRGAHHVLIQEERPVFTEVGPQVYSAFRSIEAKRVNLNGAPRNLT